MRNGLHRKQRLQKLFVAEETSTPSSYLATIRDYTGSESELLYDWRFTANQFVLETSPLSLTTSNLIFQLNTCGYSPYVTSSLTSGWVCRLQLLLFLASAVILGSQSGGTVSDSRFSEPAGPGPRIYIPQEQGCPVTSPGTGFPFRRLLRLAELRWRYSTPPPHGMGIHRATVSLLIRCGWHRKHHVQHFLYCCVHSMPRERGYITVALQR
jgi:hypothetical protein